MGLYNGEKKMTVSNESSRQTFMDNEVEEDRERDEPTSSSTTWRTCGSWWRTQGILLNGEGEPVWLTPHQRDSQHVFWFVYVSVSDRNKHVSKSAVHFFTKPWSRV